MKRKLGPRAQERARKVAAERAKAKAKAERSARRKGIRRSTIERNGDPTPPACFESQGQWDTWRHLAQVSSTILGHDSARQVDYCFDCLPSYQDKMIACGRCAHPDVYFRPVSWDKRGRPEGIRGVRRHP